MNIMPKRTPADQEAILRMYDELGSGAEVARAMGLHHNTVYAALRRARSQCVRCCAPTIGGAANCKECQEALREAVKAKRKTRKRAGLCAQCDKPVNPPSKTQCTEHRLAHMEASINHYRRSRRSRGGVPTLAERVWAIRKRFGPAAGDLWRELDGHCQLCGIHHHELAVHVHHIDKNHANRARSNLALLCFRCHRLVHHLTDAENIADALRWVEARYPGFSTRANITLN